jgi:hypothetical protein
VLEHNMVTIQRTKIRRASRLAAGPATIELRTTYAEPRPAGPLDIELSVNGEQVASGTVPISVPLLFTPNDCRNNGTCLTAPNGVAPIPRMRPVRLQRHHPAVARRLPLTTTHEEKRPAALHRRLGGRLGEVTRQLATVSAMARSIWSGTISFGQIDSFPHQHFAASTDRPARTVVADGRSVWNGNELGPRVASQPSTVSEIV